MTRSASVDGPATASEPDVAGAPGDGPEPPRARGGVPTFGSVVGGLVALWGLLIGMQALYDNSLLTHLATGRLILETGRVPTTDPYSFTAGGDPWVVQSWLASVSYGVADEIGGLGGVRTLNAVLCALLGLAVWRLSSRAPSLLVRSAVVLPVMVAATSQWVSRPLLFGLLGLAAVLLALDDRLDPRWLVPVMWVWVNTHGSFPFALLVVGLVAVGTRLDTGAWGRARRVGVWVLAGTAAAAVNPLGPLLLVFPATVLGRTESFASVVEWQAPDFTTLDQRVTLVLFVATLVVLARRPAWRSALPVAAFGLLGMTSLRNLAPLAMVVVPALSGAFEDVAKVPASIRRASFRPALGAIVALSVIFPVAMLGQRDTDLGGYPVQELDWMEARGLLGPESRVVAPDYVGNLREARDGADANVFLDDRVDMYPASLVADYGRLLGGEPGWARVLDRWDATAVVWPTDKPLAELVALSPSWRVIRHDADWTIAVRRT